ncbi:MAG TPA: rRNA maturation RNase YbeY [Gemmatimonadaceae bacterium]|jgi:rRNA maturation RNase YbeY
MSLVVAVADDGARVPLARRRVTEIARAVLRSEGVGAARLSITFVNNRRIAALNRRHLGHRGSTDVISFCLTPDAAGTPLVGDIYIAPDVARRNAAAHAVSVREELTRLVVHGVLHVLGFDHPEGEEDRRASAMWRRQEALVASITRRERRARSAA